VKNLVKNNRLYLIAIVAIIVIIVASVGVVLYYQGQNNATPTPSPTLTPALTPSPSPLSITVTDDTGHTLTLTEYPKRIVSLAPGNTQILFAVGAGDNVVGVTDYCDYPYNFSAWIEAGNMTSIGSYYGPAIEPIVALNPDLVVAARGSEDAADQLRSLGYDVLTLDPAGLDNVFQNIILVGKATGHENQATTLVASLQQRVDTVVNSVAASTTKPKVYVELYSDPYTSIGNGTFIDGLIKLAGGQNIFENSTTAYPKVQLEFVIAQNPDIIIFPDSMGLDLMGSFAGIKEREGFTGVTAIQNNTMYIVVADALNQPGPRQVDALEALAQIMHPEIFGQYTYQP
jgi:iron complex transport system substrate-binding protein